MHQGWLPYPLILALLLTLASWDKPVKASPASLFLNTKTQAGLGELRRPVNHNRVIELPLHRVKKPAQTRRRDESEVSAVGLGNANDIIYNIRVQFGTDQRATSLVLDTGSADLWVLSTNCTTCSKATSDASAGSLYNSSNFFSAMDAQLHYGDSRTASHAYGLIGKDTVSIAGLTIQDQYFAAINDTNTSVLKTGSLGLFGLGFPINSIIWSLLYNKAVSTSTSTSDTQKRRSNLYLRPRSFPVLASKTSLYSNLASDDNGNTSSVSDIDDNNRGSILTDILSSFNIFGPLIPRLILNDSSSISNPQFTITLDRESFSAVSPSGISGAVGQLTIGGLPSTIKNNTSGNSLFWTPVRAYTTSQSGISFSEAPDEAYPFAWDVPVASVYFNGIKLPSSTLGNITVEGVGESALIDTGNSLVRGPADVIVNILSSLVNSTDRLVAYGRESEFHAEYSEEDYERFISSYDAYAYAYPCSSAQSLVFEFGGIGRSGNFNTNSSNSSGNTRKFKIDARDFGTPITTEKDNGKWCIPNIAPTDAPILGTYLHSWSLGEPFLRSTLASFWYGNLTKPSQDGARIGFLSTVPGWDGDGEDESQEDVLRLQEAVHAARVSGYSRSLIPAPTGTWSSIPVTTDSHGIVFASLPPIASLETVEPNSGSRRSNGGTSNQRRLWENHCAFTRLTDGLMLFVVSGLVLFLNGNVI